MFKRSEMFFFVTKRFNNGWIIKIGRGLDFYKPPECKYYDLFFLFFSNISLMSNSLFTAKLSIGYYDLDLRPCHQTTIDIFHAESVLPSS